ncbi:MAG: hypothetical protein N3A67_02330 [Ignavibacteria bacterium]|nr:hypothetical protein [Ignavibacteria bacterium]
MPATVYQRLCLKKESFSRKDLRRIANWINSIYTKKFTEELPKVEQREGDRLFMVYLYPDEMIPIMDNIIEKFYKQKEYIAKKHSNYLKSLKNKDEKQFDKQKNSDRKLKERKINNKFTKKTYDNNKEKIEQVKSHKIEIPTVTTLRKRKTSPQTIDRKE